jgi:hypothetical protein
MATASSAPPPITAMQTRPSPDVARVEESTASIVRGAITDVGDIIKAEIALAKLEIGEDAKKLARTLPIGSAGLVLALLGAVLVLHGVAMGLGVVLPVWAAYLITAGVALVGGGAMVFFALRRLKDWKSFVPERTIASLEENEQWIRRKLS